MKRRDRHYYNGSGTYPLEYVNFSRCRSHKNGPKRKRDHRQRLRREYLERMSRRMNVIRALTTGTTLSTGDVAFIEHCPAAYSATFTSRCRDTEQRVAYIEDIYRRFFRLPDDDTDFDRVVILVTASSDWPLTDTDRRAIDHFTEQFSSRQVTLGYSTDDTLDREIRVTTAFTWPK